MRKLLNTLFMTSEDAYLTIDGENVVVNREKQEIGRFPYILWSKFSAFPMQGASPALMGGCASGRGPDLLHPTGPVLARSQESGTVMCCCAGPSTAWRTTRRNAARSPGT